MNNFKTQKQVKISTPKGDRYLFYKSVPPLKAEGGEERGAVFCQRQCPYANVCMYLPNPEHPDVKDEIFGDFCAGIADTRDKEDKDEFNYMVPVEGTIENNLGDVIPGVMDTILKSNPLIRIDKVIDIICQDMGCPDYTPDHRSCNKGNDLCILNTLFKNQGKDDTYCDDQYKKPEDMKPRAVVEGYIEEEKTETK